MRIQGLLSLEVWLICRFFFGVPAAKLIIIKFHLSTSCCFLIFPQKPLRAAHRPTSKCRGPKADISPQSRLSSSSKRPNSIFRKTSQPMTWNSLTARTKIRRAMSANKSTGTRRKTRQRLKRTHSGLRTSSRMRNSITAIRSISSSTTTTNTTTAPNATITRKWRPCGTSIMTEFWPNAVWTTSRKIIRSRTKCLVRAKWLATSLMKTTRCLRSKPAEKAVSPWFHSTERNDRDYSEFIVWTRPGLLGEPLKREIVIVFKTKLL